MLRAGRGSRQTTRRASFSHGNFPWQPPFPLFILAAICLPLALEAAELSGRVLAIDDSTALPGATIQLSGMSAGTVSGPDGAFRMSLPAGEYDIAVSFIGYRTQSARVTISTAHAARLDIALVPTTIELADVVVSATRRLQPFAKAPLSMSVVGRGELSRFNAFTLSTPMRYQSGVSQVGSQVNIRGSSGYSRGTGSRVLLLLDGVPSLSADQGDIKWDIIPVGEVERVEVIKGAGSALYGTGALGGVINVLTREPSGPETRFRLLGGTYNQPAYKSWEWRDHMYSSGFDIAHSAPFATGGYIVSAGHKRGTGYHRNGEFNRYHLFAKATHRPDERTRWQALATWAVDDHDVFLQWLGRARPLEVPAGDGPAATVSRKLNLQSELTRLLGMDATVRLRGFYFRTDFDNTRAAGSLASIGQKLGSELQLDLRRRRWGIQHNLIVGATVIQDRAKSPEDFLGQREALNTALFAQSVHHPGSAVITAGLRLDLHRRGQGRRRDLEGPCGRAAANDMAEGERTDAQLSPQLGFSLGGDASALRLSLGRGFRAPSATEIHIRADVSGILVCPNPELKSERGWSYEGGLRHRIGDWLALDAALFWNEFDDLIEGRPEADAGATPRVSFRNISRARIKGLEIEQRAALPAGARWRSSYTWIDAVEFLGAGEQLPPYCHDEYEPGGRAPLPYRSRHTLTSELSGGRRTIAGVAFRYSSRFERVSGLFAECRRDHVPVYLSDLFFAREIGDMGGVRELSLNLRVDNLFQYHYVLTERKLRPLRRVSLAVSGTL